MVLLGIVEKIILNRHFKLLSAAKWYQETGTLLGYDLHQQNVNLWAIGPLNQLLFVSKGLGAKQ